MTRAHLLEATITVMICVGLLAVAPMDSSLWSLLGPMALAVLVAPLLRPRLGPGGLPPTLPVALGLVFAVGAWLGGLAPTSALAVGLAGLAVGGRFTRRGPTDDRLGAAVALLLVTLGASRSADPLVGLAVIAWVTLAPPLLVLTTLARSGDRPARHRPVVGRHLLTLSLLALVLGLLLFLALPRRRGADLAGFAADADQARIGFSEEVALGEVSELLDDPTVALRVTDGAFEAEPVYLRGRILDRFDGRRWTTTLPRRPEVERAQGGTRALRVVQEAEAGAVAFAPGPIVAVTSEGARFTSDHAGTWSLTGAPRRVVYNARYRSLGASPALDLPEWRQLPADLDPRFAELADRIIGEVPEALSAARRVETWLESERTYSHAPRDTALDAPLAAFLVEGRPGHCSYFATAAAVLLRSEGHAARLVTGYARPERNPISGHLTARRGHAHAWVEIRGDDGRWHTMDPTPGGNRPPPPPSALETIHDALMRGWTDGVLAYDGGVQAGLAIDAGWWVQTRVTGRPPGPSRPWLGWILVVLPIVGGAWGVWRTLRALGRRLAGERPAVPRGRIARLHHKARRALARAGLEPPPGLPPVDAARWIRARTPEIGAPLEALAWLHYRVRYGGEDEASLVADARAHLGDVRRATARHRGGSSPGAPR